MSRTATCRCGQLRITVRGEPGRVSVCHCHACQKRSGSAFSWQARWPAEQTSIEGEAKTWVKIGDSGASATFSFCPECGTNVFYTNEGLPGQIAVPLGGLAGQDQPAPKFSVYENRMQPWLALLPDDIEHN